jgi:hypothetical protein
MAGRHGELGAHSGNAGTLLKVLTSSFQMRLDGVAKKTSFIGAVNRAITGKAVADTMRKALGK